MQVSDSFMVHHGGYLVENFYYRPPNRFMAQHTPLVIAKAFKVLSQFGYWNPPEALHPTATISDLIINRDFQLSNKKKKATKKNFSNEVELTRYFCGEHLFDLFTSTYYLYTTINPNPPMAKVKCNKRKMKEIITLNRHCNK